MKVKAIYAWLFFGCSTDTLVFFGVTGTDGKSTTCGALYRILESVGVSVGIISTVHIDIGEGLKHNETHMTSLGHVDFWKLISKAKKNGITHLVLEVSSHALYQYRIRPISFHAVGITNLTREHLDFHWTMHHYAKTKALLFSLVQEDGVAVLPDDFSWKSTFYESIGNKKIRVLSFGKNNAADIWVDNVQQQPELSFDLHGEGYDVSIFSPLIGSFNCDNLMIAVLLSRSLGITRDEIIFGISSYKGLPGRQQRLVTSNGITAMIDFALTPDALRVLYTAVRDMGYNRIIAVFGATGNRDQGKRPKMGAVADKYVDIAILTEDENYHENGRDIMEDVSSGISKMERKQEGNTIESEKGTYYMIQDRRKAISYGLHIAQKGDVIIITGMADFTSRSMNEGSIPRNEKEVILEEMKSLGLQIDE